MLIFGDHKCFPQGNALTLLSKNGFAAFNFSSYVQNCAQLSNLLPKNGVDCSSEENFDMSYFDYLYNDEYAFIELMYIVNQLYMGANVFIFINHTEFYDKLAESFAEIIKQRYGYISHFINEPDDYDSILNNIDDSDFSVIGLRNLDTDRARFTSIMYDKGLFKDDPEDYS